jgi:hypothetical protein
MVFASLRVVGCGIGRIGCLFQLPPRTRELCSLGRRRQHGCRTPQLVNLRVPWPSRPACPRTRAPPGHPHAILLAITGRPDAPLAVALPGQSPERAAARLAAHPGTALDVSGMGWTCATRFARMSLASGVAESRGGLFQFLHVRIVKLDFAEEEFLVLALMTIGAAGDQ